jgi:type IV conjugative transfer system coupling protein TraD
MKRDLVNFTRGSQLIGHFGFMFAAGLKGPLFVALATFSGLIWWRASTQLSDHESYLCWMRGYAWIYGWFAFDPAKKINLELASGGHLQLAITQLANHPLVVAAWARFMEAVREGAILAAVVVLPATAAFAWIATWFGRRSKEGRHERGATLAKTAELIVEIGAHNAVERAREYRAALGPAWRLSSSEERRQASLYEPYALAGVPFPWRLEQSHAMLIGTTGTGKTVALRDLLTQVRARDHRAVVFDLTGAFIEAFYDPARDVILNPLDARCPRWSVFEDCRDEAALTAAAEALVPHDGGGSEQFWVLAARMLFVEMCLKLIAEGRATNAALSSELMTASLAHVHRMMEGTVADPLTAPEAARMAESIRAVFNANAKALRMLPQSGPKFSVRDWTQGQCKPGSFLFVSARYVDMAVASRLLTVWMDTAITTLMAGPRSGDLKLWFLFDELGALHRLPAIEKGLQTVRNYGGAIVAGVHAYAKLKETYGDNMAMTLAALARTKLVLATADRESATWCSDFIGHRQFREMEEGYSYGYNNARDAVSLTPRRHIEPLLLPDQLMNLPRLQGYLKYPDGFPAAPIRLRYVDYPSIAPAFVARVPTRIERPASNAGARPSDTSSSTQNDQGPGPQNETGSTAARTEPSPGPLFEHPERADTAQTRLPVLRPIETGTLPEERASVPPPDARTVDGTASSVAISVPSTKDDQQGGSETHHKASATPRGRLGITGPLPSGKATATSPDPENLAVVERKQGVASEVDPVKDDYGMEP